MPRRVFGTPVSVSQNTVPEKDVAVVESSDAPVKTPELPKEELNEEGRVKKKVSKVPKITAVIVVAVIILIGSIVFYNKAYDSHYGDTDPVDAAKGYITAMLSHNDINEHLPADIRDSAMVSAETAWICKFPYCDIENISADIMKTSSDDYKQYINVLEEGFSAVYSKDISIDDAKIVHMTAHVTGDGYDNILKFDVITVKKGFKWYVYTGDTGRLDGVSVLPEQVSTDKLDAGTDPDVTEPVSFLEPYAGAADDAASGKFKFNGKSVTLPAQYNEVTDLLQLNDELIDDSFRLVSSEVIMSKLPVVLSDETYDSSCVTVDIANINDDAVDVSNGIVVGITVRRSLNGRTPDIALPGNVRIGTAFSDIESLYGSVFEAVSFDEDLAAVSGVSFLYKISLGLEGNDVYFGFDSDDKLTAVKWIYSDLNDHISYERS